jgi:tetrahydromethanopterin S-methyltransferase subunit C
MVRSFAACLGCIAMISQIALGIAMDVETETILAQSVIALLIASAVGWVIGKLADELVRDMIETPKRHRNEQLPSRHPADPSAR